jgi:hypothetical protein
MSEPVYGKQYVRFAETLKVNGKEALQYRLLQDVGIAAGGAATGVYATTINAAGGEIAGVNQYSIPAVNEVDSVTLPAEPQSSRLASVANSGLLLVLSDPINPPDLGGPIFGKTNGTVDDGTVGSPVTFAGGDITVREIVKAGGYTYALCHFV